MKRSVRDVRFWHLADKPIAAMNVRFRHPASFTRTRPSAAHKQLSLLSYAPVRRHRLENAVPKKEFVVVGADHNCRQTDIALTFRYVR